MKKNLNINLTTEEALVLQQISEFGEDDIIDLSNSLHMTRQKVMACLSRLSKKGLIVIKTTYGGWWVQVSSKGDQFVHSIWPEYSGQPAF